ncbi:hypothetical protein [Pedosphaera parvula]|uniref:Uncharacterized protein n=1 Tax=Pedosphaera parvula (strain Ellin514) TaxID=320771 RepID=B9XPP9_PEDPL|nr:hypothetical protein [Pedosphaera parvula]EEF58172.1 hypothetical protein Cflav_PD1372 [Pedosphaera parvula Ellin514]
MNETNPQASADSALNDLQAQVRSLRLLLITTLALVFIFSAGVNLYLTHQSKMAKAQADEAEKVIAQFNGFGAPWANDFWNRLLAYSKAHPDFNPVIEKYRPYITAPPQAGTTGVAPKK